MSDKRKKVLYNKLDDLYNEIKKSAKTTDDKKSKDVLTDMQYRVSDMFWMLNRIA